MHGQAATSNRFSLFQSRGRLPVGASLLELLSCAVEQHLCALHRAAGLLQRTLLPQRWVACVVQIESRRSPQPVSYPQSRLTRAAAAAMSSPPDSASSSLSCRSDSLAPRPLFNGRNNRPCEYASQTVKHALVPYVARLVVVDFANVLGLRALVRGRKLILWRVQRQAPARLMSSSCSGGSSAVEAVAASTERDLKCFPSVSVWRW
jgi:hypothetical protein